MLRRVLLLLSAKDASRATDVVVVVVVVLVVLVVVVVVDVNARACALEVGLHGGLHHSGI